MKKLILFSLFTTFSLFIALELFLGIKFFFSLLPAMVETPSAVGHFMEDYSERVVLVSFFLLVAIFHLVFVLRVIKKKNTAKSIKKRFLIPLILSIIINGFLTLSLTIANLGNDPSASYTLPLYKSFHANNWITYDDHTVGISFRYPSEAFGWRVWSTQRTDTNPVNTFLGDGFNNIEFSRVASEEDIQQLIAYRNYEQWKIKIGNMSYTAYGYKQSNFPDNIRVLVPDDHSFTIVTMHPPETDPIYYKLDLKVIESIQRI